MMKFKIIIGIPFLKMYGNIDLLIAILRVKLHRVSWPLQITSLLKKTINW